MADHISFCVTTGELINLILLLIRLLWWHSKYDYIRYISYQWPKRSKNHEKNGVQKVIKNAPNRPKLQESTPLDERDRLRTILTFITQATPAIFHPFCPFLVLFCGQPISRKSSFCCIHTDICPMGVSFHLARANIYEKGA